MIKRSQVVATVAAVSIVWTWISLEGGIVLDAYIPVPGDVPTIAAGHTEGVKLGDKITYERGYQLAVEDATDAARAVLRCAYVPMYENELQAYTLLAGNIGGGRFCRSSIPKKLKAGNYAAACATILEFNCGPAINEKRAKKGEKCYHPTRPMRVINGLVNRRNTEYQICIKNPNAAPSLDAGNVASSG